LYLLFFYKRKQFYYLICASTLALFGFNALCYFEGNAWLNVFPASIQRVLLTLYFPQTLNMLSSRFYFIAVGWYIFLDYPLSGIGLDKFYQFFPFYANELKFFTDGWSDSACNFMFGILTDGGIILFLAMLFFFVQLRFKKHIESVHMAALLGLCAILLFFHLLFVEVVFLLALLSAFIFNCSAFGKFECIKTTFWGKFLFARPKLILIVLLAIHASYQFIAGEALYGIYNWERKTHYFTNWIAKEASFPLKCSADKATLLFSIPRQKRLFYPVTVSYVTPYEHGVYQVKNRRRIQTELSCYGKNKINVHLKLDRAWLPSSTGDSHDTRLLGLRIYVEKIA